VESAAVTCGTEKKNEATYKFPTESRCHAAASGECCMFMRRPARNMTERGKAEENEALFLRNKLSTVVERQLQLGGRAC